MPNQTTPAKTERHECPIEGITGHIVVDKFLSGPDYLKWYKTIMADDSDGDKEKPSVYRMYAATRHIIKEVKVAGYPDEQWNGSGETLPPVLIRWATHVTGLKLTQAQDPNLFAGPLPSTSGT